MDPLGVAQVGRLAVAEIIQGRGRSRMAVNPESDDTSMAHIFVTRKIPAAGLKPLSDRAKVVVSPLDKGLPDIGLHPCQSNRCLFI